MMSRMWYLLECAHYGHETDETQHPEILRCKTCKNKYRRIVQPVADAGTAIMREASGMPLPVGVTLQFHADRSVRWK